MHASFQRLPTDAAFNRPMAALKAAEYIPSPCGSLTLPAVWITRDSLFLADLARRLALKVMCLASCWGCGQFLCSRNEREAHGNTLARQQTAFCGESELPGQNRGTSTDSRFLSEIMHGDCRPIVASSLRGSEKLCFPSMFLPQGHHILPKRFLAMPPTAPTTSNK
jgi:hypothetical protein